ncbi:MAG: M20/M25/M40 family metallo-hydrolase [Candidatus Omnitrophica bacterium]|nr:M20/M25/M40 family metallo-hydrolase [Candidatus Omnitrophota bacterium]
MLNDCVQFVLEQARYVIENFGPRPPGSEGEKRLQEYVRQKLTEFAGGEATLDSFPVAPKAFMSVPMVTALLLMPSLVLYWWSIPLALAFSGLSFLAWFHELFRYRCFFDGLFPKRISSNVMAAIPPKGPVERRIVLNAHPDAAYEWRWNYLFPKQLPVILLYGLLALPLKFLSDALALVVSIVAGGESQLLFSIGLFQILLVPALAIGLFFTNYGVVSPGANDNLSGVFIALGLARHFGRTDRRLDRTEIAFLITGSEEAGLRGAKHFVKKNHANGSDIETVFVTLDTFRDEDFLAIYTKDMNGTVTHDARLSRLMKEAGLDCGWDLPYSTVTVGSTDAAAFTQGGMHAVALAAMNPKCAPFYHTRRDHWDNMSAECLRKTIQVVMKAIDRYDSGGLPELP